jgi:hypothetical protein
MQAARFEGLSFDPFSLPQSLIGNYMSAHRPDIQVM